MLFINGEMIMTHELKMDQVEAFMKVCAIFKLTVQAIPIEDDMWRVQAYPSHDNTTVKYLTENVMEIYNSIYKEGFKDAAGTIELKSLEDSMAKYIENYNEADQIIKEAEERIANR